MLAEHIGNYILHQVLVVCLFCLWRMFTVTVTQCSLSYGSKVQKEHHILYASMVKAQATRSPQERNTRLENMCWRIWNLACQKKNSLRMRRLIEWPNVVLSVKRVAD